MNHTSAERYTMTSPPQASRPIGQSLDRSHSVELALPDYSGPTRISSSPSNSKRYDNRLTLGAQGERIALSYLEEDGYLLEAKNWRGRRGELDLVMRVDTTLVFVEVRTTTTRWLDRPAEATPITKQRQVARCADEYYQQRHPAAAQITDIRFDVIGVLISSEASDQLGAPLTGSTSESSSNTQATSAGSQGAVSSASAAANLSASPLGYEIDHVEDAYYSPFAY